MAIEVVRLVNPGVLLVPAFQDFMKRAFAKSLFAPDGFEATAEDMVNVIIDPKAMILVAADGPNAVGISITYFPVDRIIPHPQIAHFYVDPKSRAKKKLMEETVAIIKKHGYMSFKAVNGSGTPDAVWQRTFNPKGWKSRPVGTIMQFEAQQ